MRFYPDFDSLSEVPTKSRLLEVRRSFRSILSLILVCAASVVIVYLIIYYAHVSGFYKNLPLLRHFSPRYLGVIPLLFLLEIVRRRHDDLYIFGLHRLTHLKGRFSLSYNIPVIKYSDIRAINVSQDFMGRIFDYGSVSIGTAAHEGNELLVAGVRAPEELAKLIDDLRSNSLRLGEIAEEEDLSVD